MTRLIAILLALAIAACGSTQQASQSARSTWVGQSSDDFFVRHGAPKMTHTLASGGKVYSWETVAMPSGTRIQIACTADIVTDPRGVIVEIRLQEDTIGHWNTSRCSEIFGS